MSQVDRLKQHIRDGNTISPLEALGVFRCFRLAARIEQLRRAPHCMAIITEMREDKTGKRYARYQLAKCGMHVEIANIPNRTEWGTQEGLEVGRLGKIVSVWPSTGCITVETGGIRYFIPAGSARVVG